jgi:uncharacterized membrane protein (UPF0127 family)
VKWKTHLLTFVVIFVAVVLVAQSCRPRSQAGGVPPPDARFVTLVLDGRPERLSEFSYEVRAELADTPQKRAQGLAGRPGLEPGGGMLYVYDEPRRPEFSEAATRFPLSIAFLRDDGTIAEVRDTAALDQDVVQPEEPVRYILEVRAGWFADRGVGPGARFLLPDLPPVPLVPSQIAEEPAPAS